MNDTNGKDPNKKPLIALTMGDPAGIGPEIIASGWKHFAADDDFRYVVFGQAAYLRRAVEQMELDIKVEEIFDIDRAHDTIPHHIVVLTTGVGGANDIKPGKVDRVAGNAAFEYITTAITTTLEQKTDAIVTAPINKEAIQLAGHDFPGHTEILAERCGVQDFAMMLYIPEGQDVGGEIGLGVVHTTLHQSLRSALDDLSTDNILGKCRLAHEFADRSLKQLGIDRAPRIAVAALNPHAGENGLFGNEEIDIIAPAVALANRQGIGCVGPLPCDTLMGRAVAGEFDMVVAMYHDQGHIALKLLGMHKAVNVTLGLPIIRTSVAHGTAFEIAGKGEADCTSLLRAIDVAKRLVRQPVAR